MDRHDDVLHCIFQSFARVMRSFSSLAAGFTRMALARKGARDLLSPSEKSPHAD